MGKIFFLAFLMGGVTAQAKTVEKWASYQLQKISLNGVRDIKISGVRGTLSLRGRSRAKGLNLRVRHSNSRKYEDWYLAVEKRGKTLYLEVFSAAYGAQWRNQVKKELWPDFDIDLEGAALPTTVAWLEGNLDFSDWDANLEAAFLTGTTVVKGGQGLIDLQPVQATVSVKDHRGEIRIKGESGQVSLERDMGPLNLNWLKGQIALLNCQGKIHLDSSDSELKVRGGGGQLSVQMQKGQAQVSDFKGEIDGRTDQVHWLLSEAAPANVNLVNERGTVGMLWQSGGAKVFLTSTQGSIDILHSDFLSSETRDGHQVAQGTKLARNMGQVFIRTESGTIRWRQ